MLNIPDILVLASLGIFGLLFLGRTILLQAQGVKVWVIGASAKKVSEKILESLLFPVLILWCLAVILTALHGGDKYFIFRILLEARWLKITGLFLCYGGLLLFLSALLSFGQAWRIGIDENNSPALVTTGIFKYSRNPIFLFMDLYFAGIALIYPGLFFILAALLVLPGLHLQILREEKFLQNKFGQEYSAYKASARRYL
ncbi:MAG: isoprenylcysteine carboxylmethyltransferase family protein, partial [Candidatus Margulisbacteria bacterium]|jgi:protein-S-isoprenylcysteine O-methyltransferase Ste14|nr:isoprenylcysteine carboxylmethyltransferase family protein [Candidatus Margulisiibacteriota bacterium]